MISCFVNCYVLVKHIKLFNIKAFSPLKLESNLLSTRFYGSALPVVTLLLLSITIVRAAFLLNWTNCLFEIYCWTLFAIHIDQAIRLVEFCSDLLRFVIHVKYVYQQYNRLTGLTVLFITDHPLNSWTKKNWLPYLVLLIFNIVDMSNFYFKQITHTHTQK